MTPVSIKTGSYDTPQGLSYTWCLRKNKGDQFCGDFASWSTPPLSAHEILELFPKSKIQTKHRKP